MLLVVIAVGLPGCSTTRFVTLREKPRNPLLERLRFGSAGMLQPSDRTSSYLIRTNAPETAESGELLLHVRTQLNNQQPTAESLHAASELSYIAAKQTARDDLALQEELYLDAAQYAWQYLAGVHDGEIRDPNQTRHRKVAEAYNSATEAFIRILYEQRDPQRAHTGLALPLTGRNIKFEVPRPSPWLQPDQIGEIEFVSDYEVSNLTNRHVARGIGVPIIIHRKRPLNPTSLENYYAKGVRFPATAVLKFPTPDQQRAGVPTRLQVYDPRESDGVVVRDAALPLETDLSTPLARFLNNPDLQLLDTFAFLRPDKADQLRGLYMIQPWDPDRIPVLMVHGLWSSPMTWMEMFNELQSDPVLREQYQFWFYMYPTGEPATFALADLRDELQQLRQRCDPHEDNEKFDQMVLVGHSMGGLLSYLMTVDSSDKLWSSVSTTPIDQLKADTDTKSEIHRVFFFESDPTIDRIVTIATPFQGSRYANRFTQWLSNAVVTLPSKTLEATRLLTSMNGQAAWEKVFTPRTSLDSLAKRSAVVKLIGHTTTPDDVAHHNIVGVSRGRSRKWWTDGVVTWRSAHRDDADSELNVDASHSQVHRRPESIEEVRRVLTLHLQESRRGLKVIPVSRETALTEQPRRVISKSSTTGL